MIRRILVASSSTGSLRRAYDQLYIARKDVLFRCLQCLARSQGSGMLGDKQGQREDVDCRRIGFMEQKTRVAVCGQFEKGNLNPAQTTQAHSDTIRTAVALAA